MAEPLEFRPSRALLALWWVRNAAVGLPCSGFFGFALAENQDASAGLAGGLVCFSLFVVVSLCMTVHFFTIRYSLDDAYVVRAAGFLWKVKRSVPLEKITNIDVRQGPIERLLGFGQVWIFTPSTGHMMPEAKLTGVVETHRIKDEIVARSERAKSNLPARAEAPPATAKTAPPDEVVPLLREMSGTLKRIEEKLGRRDAT